MGDAAAGGAGARSAGAPRAGGAPATAADPPEPAAPGPRRGLRVPRARMPRTGSARGRRRGAVTAGCAVLTAVLLVLPGAVPNAGPRAGSLLETFLPWLGAPALLLAAAALLRRAPAALAASALPLAAWLVLFGPMLLPAGPGGHDLTAVQHNVSDENADPAGTARALLRAAPELIALQELTPGALPAYREVLEPRYPHHAVVGSVGLWSVHPLQDARRVDIRPRGFDPAWNRGLRATLRAPSGDLAVYVAHLPSMRLGVPEGLRSGPRDEAAALLGGVLAKDGAERTLLLGDLNGTVDDRGLAPVTSRLGVHGPGFAFSWPASLPVARIDHVLARGADVVRIDPLPATGSDHLPVVARIRL
ncbi:endonuclease/exonuclease/phosphatase family protein [Streptomyces sp. NPDC047968]|uniref:endonuclease/exonuclease/phosphatase family protein n=2 Tax=unclassified Streptomyces TaxID=2593676 RepID=UPI00342DE489